MDVLPQQVVQLYSVLCGSLGEASSTYNLLLPLTCSPGECSLLLEDWPSLLEYGKWAGENDLGPLR